MQKFITVFTKNKIINSNYLILLCRLFSRVKGLLSWPLKRSLVQIHPLDVDKIYTFLAEANHPVDNSYLAFSNLSHSENIVFNFLNLLYTYEII